MMKVFDSGMPDESYWTSLFNIPLIMNWLNIETVSGPIVEIGCGYGTFTVPVAMKTKNQVFTFDIEPSMIDKAKENVSRSGQNNVQFFLRDILETGTGLETEGIGMILLFNILHSDERRRMLAESSRILKPSGVVAVIHWRKDITTPRGPAVHTRPDQATILESTSGMDLHFEGNSRVLEPYHWGMQLVKGTPN
jgi:SAM-dependent methyltransferase